MNITQPEIDFFAKNGFLVITPELPENLLDEAREDLRPWWENGIKPKHFAHADSDRIQDAWMSSDAIREIALYDSILSALRELYNKEPKPFQTLNFPKGTEQAAHSDSIHFNSEPFGNMCGVWVALEDIGANQGPLVYYPGSNLLQEMNFEDLNLPPSYDYYPEYEQAIQAKISEHGLKPEYGIIKKGQAIIWAANLLHGGSVQKDKSLSRHSQVTHYYFENDKYWRPGFSENGRHYFEPVFIHREFTPPKPKKKSLFRRLKQKIRNSRDK